MSDNPAVVPAETKPASGAGSPDVMTPPPPSTNHGPPPAEIFVQRPTSISPPPRTSPLPQQRESPIDPRVVALRALFPDYEDVILQSVLESVNWNQDRAVDALLTMSDPEYKPEPAAQRQPEPTPVLSQEDLDEQFARQLALQEQQEHSQWAASGQNYGPQGSPAPYNGPRSNQPQGWASPPQQGGGQQGQGMAEFQEQIGKIAETGKKTLGSFFSKVRTKIQEFEQGKPTGPGGSTSPPSQYSSTQWAPGPASYYGPPQAGPPQAQASYYNPNQSPVNTPSHPQPPAPLISNLTGLRSTSSPSTSPLPSNNLQSRPRSVSPPVTNSATTAQPIDSGKLRLPPKQQPISLMALQDSHSIDSASSTDSPTIPNAQPLVIGGAGKAPAAGAGAVPTHAGNKGYSVDDDDDGLEYTENPFDEGRK